MDQIPESPERRAQRLRISRSWLAIGGSAVTVAMSAMAYWAGYLPAAAVANYAALVTLACLVFYTLIRTGVNLRFADPSLTVAQLATAGLAISYLVYHGDEARQTFLLMYLLAYAFGAFQLGRRGLAGIAVFYIACYGATIGLAHLWRPESVELDREAYRLSIFAVVLAWMSYLCIYAARLRVHLRRTTAELRDALALANTLATHDSLTDCYNRRRMMEILEVESRRAKRGAALCLCLLDIDHFKTFNDRHGHLAGDEVLRQFAALVQKQLRETDSLARYGGEEFLIVLTDTPASLAMPIAERIRRAVAAERFASLPAGTGVTVSAGIAEHRPAELIDQTLSRVDAALYQAKSQGRNRSVLAA